MKKIILGAIMAVIIVGGGAFYGGMKYAESRNPRGQFLRAEFQNLSFEERQARFAQAGGDRRAGGIRAGQGGGFASGEIISQDDKSITVKLQDGGSKIIFLSDTTRITKSTEGFLADLKSSTQIFANGTPNQDGSMTADAVQISPARMPFGAGIQRP